MSYLTDSLEIERKFLLTEEQFEQIANSKDPVLTYMYRIRQGYLLQTEDISVRIRVEDNFGMSETHWSIQKPYGVMAIKMPKAGSWLVREEYECEVGAYASIAILDAVDVIEKIRFKYDKYCVDVFMGDLSGLIIAECEYKTEEEAIADSIPEWVEKEVTEIREYRNVNLANKRFVNGQLIGK